MVCGVQRKHEAGCSRLGIGWMTNHDLSECP